MSSPKWILWRLLIFSLQGKAFTDKYMGFSTKTQELFRKAKLIDLIIC